MTYNIQQRLHETPTVFGENHFKMTPKTAVWRHCFPSLSDTFIDSPAYAVEVVLGLESELGLFTGSFIYDDILKNFYPLCHHFRQCSLQNNSGIFHS